MEANRLRLEKKRTPLFNQVKSFNEKIVKNAEIIDAGTLKGIRTFLMNGLFENSANEDKTTVVGTGFLVLGCHLQTNMEPQLALKSFENARTCFAISQKSLIERQSGGNNEGEALLNMGNALQSLEKYDDALKTYEMAEKFFREVFGENSEYVGFAHNNTAAVLVLKGEVKSGLERYELAKEIYLKAYGEGDPQIAAVFVNMGRVFQSQQKYPEAIKKFEEAIDLLIQYNKGCPEHVSVVAALRCLGDCEEEGGMLQEAEKSFDRALTLLKAIFQGDEQHRYIADLLNRLGTVLFLQKKYDKALPVFKNNLAVCLGLFGESDPNTEAAMEKVSVTHQMLTAQRKK